MATILLTATQRWQFPAQLAAAFTALGTRVEALCPRDAKLSRSRHVSRVYPHSLLQPAAALQSAVEQSDADLMIPCDDDAAELIRAYQGLAPLPGRAGFLAQAEAAGAPIAAFIAVTGDSDVEAGIATLGLPLVVKSDQSWGGDGVVIAATREAVHQAVRAMRQPSRLRQVVRAVRRRKYHHLGQALAGTPPGIVLQRFVAGPPATSSIACWQGELVAAHHFDVLLTPHPTGPASVIARTDCPGMEDTARRLAKSLRLSGLFGLDYVRDARGNVHLLEMNARATPTSHLALDQDLPAALLAAAALGWRRRPAVTQAREIALSHANGCAIRPVPGSAGPGMTCPGTTLPLCGPASNWRPRRPGRCCRHWKICR